MILQVGNLYWVQPGSSGSQVSCDLTVNWWTGLDQHREDIWGLSAVTSYSGSLAWAGSHGILRFQELRKGKLHANTFQVLAYVTFTAVALVKTKLNGYLVSLWKGPWKSNGYREAWAGRTYCDQATTTKPTLSWYFNKMRFCYMCYVGQGALTNRLYRYLCLRMER